MRPFDCRRLNPMKVEQGKKRPGLWEEAGPKSCSDLAKLPPTGKLRMKLSGSDAVYRPALPCTRTHKICDIRRSTSDAWRASSRTVAMSGCFWKRRQGLRK